MGGFRGRIAEKEVMVLPMNQLSELVGRGLYSPVEAAKLTAIPSRKIRRWLSGHEVGGRRYLPLWQPQTLLENGEIVLGFRDLMELRVAFAFLSLGMSAVAVRRAIELAREIVGSDRPLSTDRVRTDGREAFLQTLETSPEGEPQERLLNLFRRQYEFKAVIDPILKTVDFEEHDPIRWWPAGRRGGILVDPRVSFGQPITAEDAIPTAILAQSADQLGVAQAAHLFDTPRSSVEKALRFEKIEMAKLAA